MIRAVLLALVLLPVDFLVAQNDGVNTVGRKMPEDVAPLSDQVYRYLSFEPVSLDIGVTLYQSSESEFMYDRLCMLNYKNELVPGAVPAMNASWIVLLANGSATCPVIGSTVAKTMLSGGTKPVGSSRSPMCARMNSIQIGRATLAPSSPLPSVTFSS